MFAEKITKELNRFKYFLSVTILSFFALILIASCVLFVSFLGYRSNVKTDALNLQVEKLNSYSTQIDFKYNKYLSTISQLNSDEDIRSWIKSPDTDYYLLSIILNKLNSSSVLNDALFSLEIYKASSNSVLSNNNGYNDAESTFVKNRIPLYNNFMQTESIGLTVESAETINGVNTPTVLMVSSLPVHRKLGAIGMVIQANKLLPQDVDPNASVFLVDANGNAIYLNGNAKGFLNDNKTEMHFRRLVNLSDLSNRVNQVSIHKTKYYTISKNILNNQFSLLEFIPETKIDANLGGFSEYFLIAIALIIVLSLFYSFLIYLTANKPIKAVVKSIAEKMNLNPAGNNPYINDDINYIGNTFNALLSKNYEIEKKLSGQMEFIKVKSLRNIIYGITDETENLYYTESNPEIQNNFVILIFNYDNIHEQQFFCLDNFAVVMADFLEKFNVNYLRTALRQYTLLVNLNVDQDRDYLIREVNAKLDAISKLYGNTFTVSVSSLKHQIDEISVGYDEAQNAIKYKILPGYYKIIDSTELHTEKRMSDNLSVEDGQILIKALRADSDENVQELLNHMIDEKIQKYSVELLNAYFMYISFCIAQVEHEYNINSEVIFDNAFYKMLIDYGTIEEKKEYLKNQCKKITDYRNSEQKKYKKLSSEIAIMFIQKNFTKPLSLDLIADELHMSPSYLSRLIKQELGINFINYLNHLRIEYSKELLRKENVTIKEIATLVGYDSDHTFIRNFKQITGKTPTDFRYFLKINSSNS